MTNNPNSVVRSLLIPIQEAQLLLPSAVVAEVTPYSQPDKTFDSYPEWWLGIIAWRNQQVPLIAIEKLLSSFLSAPPPTTKYRTIILYGLESSQVPFYALVAIDVPKAIEVSEESLSYPKGDMPAGLAFSVTMNNQETVWLPDLTYIENLIKKLLLTNKMEN